MTRPRQPLLHTAERAATPKGPDPATESFFVSLVGKYGGFVSTHTESCAQLGERSCPAPSFARAPRVALGSSPAVGFITAPFPCPPCPEPGSRSKQQPLLSSCTKHPRPGGLQPPAGLQTCPELSPRDAFLPAAQQDAGACQEHGSGSHRLLKNEKHNKKHTEWLQERHFLGGKSRSRGLPCPAASPGPKAATAEGAPGALREPEKTEGLGIA